MQDIAEKLKSFAGQAGEGLNKGLDTLKDKASQAGDYLQANPALAAMLLAGGGAGLLGGYLTSQQPEEEGESKMSRRGRILRNALLAAAAGAGTVGLGAEGYKRLAEAVPEGSVNPVQEKLTSPFARGAGAAGAGIIGFSKGRNLDYAELADKARNFLRPADQIAAKGMKPEEVIAFAESKGFTPRTSGFFNPAIFKGSPKLNKVLSTLIGTSRGGQLARAGGAVGLMIPEILSGAKDLVLQND
jgi:hypothetical protein